MKPVFRRGCGVWPGDGSCETGRRVSSVDVSVTDAVLLCYGGGVTDMHAEEWVLVSVCLTHFASIRLQVVP